MGNLNKKLNRFLDNDNDKVMLVTGVWGIGKTYQVVNEWAGNDASIKSRCKIVTLFGSETIDGLIWDIIVGVGGISIIKGGLGILNMIIGKVFDIKIPAETIIKSIPTIVRDINLAEQILIVDDIERKNDNIKLKEILNLVESIKRNFCKIILIMDRTKLNDEDSEYLDNYFEKIIDKHYEITTPSEEAKRAMLTEISKELYRYLEISDVKNLRTLQKLNSFVSDSKNSLIQEKTSEIKALYYKLYLFAYRMVKNNEFSAEECAENDHWFRVGLFSSGNKSEYEKMQTEEQYYKEQLFIYSHYTKADLLAKQVSNRSLFNKTINLSHYFSKAIKAIESGDTESIFEINVAFSRCPQDKYEYTPSIHEVKDIKTYFSDIENIANRNNFDPVSVYVNYFMLCTFSWAKYYEEDKDWFRESFIKAAKNMSNYIIENKYVYEGIGELNSVEGRNDISRIIKKIIDEQLEASILDLVELELNKDITDYSKVVKLFAPYTVYRYAFETFINEARYIQIGRRLITKLFTGHLQDFYATFHNVYTNCFYTYIDLIHDLNKRNELIKYAREYGYKDTE